MRRVGVHAMLVLALQPGTAASMAGSDEACEDICSEKMRILVAEHSAAIGAINATLQGLQRQIRIETEARMRAEQHSAGLLALWGNRAQKSQSLRRNASLQHPSPPPLAGLGAEHAAQQLGAASSDEIGARSMLARDARSGLGRSLLQEYSSDTAKFCSKSEAAGVLDRGADAVIGMFETNPACAACIVTCADVPYPDILTCLYS
jgi:hypothetical protein